MEKSKEKFELHNEFKKETLSKGTVVEVKVTIDGYIIGSKDDAFKLEDALKYFIKGFLEEAIVESYEVDY